jgi:hypothetical protein
MPIDSVAMRALNQIRGGRGSPVNLARRAILGPSADPDSYMYTDHAQEAADSLDEYDAGAMAMPGDPYPDRPFDPGDETRAAAIDAYNRGPKPGADMEPDPYDPMEGMEGEAPHSMGMGGARNAAEAVDALGPIFAQLGQGSAYAGDVGGPAPDLGSRYLPAGQAPQVGGTDEELEMEKRRLIAGGY